MECRESNHESRPEAPKADVDRQTDSEPGPPDDAVSATPSEDQRTRQQQQQQQQQ